MKIDIIAGARPNFIKIAPIIEALSRKNTLGFNFNIRIIHTGQHYDKNMSGNFFEELEIPEPHLNLGAGGGTQAQQTAAIMIGYENVLYESKPDLCVVVGDVTSTMACAIVARKMMVPVAHVEAGIRSGDLSMPEEINRIVTDSISNIYFTTTEFADENLLRSGASPQNIFRVGNTMIDTLIKKRSKFVQPSLWKIYNLEIQKYIILTLHRPSNVDSGNSLSNVLEIISEYTAEMPVIFPVHPRTRKFITPEIRLKDNFYLIEPLGYLEFNYLVENALAVITDSGGITEETTVLGIPCITLRNSTERPETILMGTNELVGDNFDALKSCLQRIMSGSWKKGSIPDLWDGKTSERIVDVLITLYHKS